MKATGGTLFKRHISALEPPWRYIISPPFTRRDANAKEVLPPELYRQIQEHFTGLLWVSSDTQFYVERRRLVLALKDQGVSTQEIAKLAGVTSRRVRQIVSKAQGA